MTGTMPLTTTKDGEELAQLRETINEVWAALYPGAEPVNDVFALTMRIKNIAQDRNDCAFNARVLQKAYNELDERLRASQQTEIELCDAHCTQQACNCSR